MKNNRDVRQLIAEYDKLPEAFYLTDLQQILDVAGRDTFELISAALKVGYMVGRSESQN